jgi:SAM-dependent methyltransferase
MGNCCKQLFRKIFPQKTDLDFPPSYISNRFIMEQVDRGPILVVGDYTGRDFLPLKRKYPDTYLLDIVDNKITDENFVLQSITEPTTFGEETFQYVVMAEVIEHLWEDVAALQEVHRLLVPGGGLVLTVPFYHDLPEFHFRMHSPQTIRRLLEYCGFEVVEMAYRGWAMKSNLLAAGLALILFPFMGNRAMATANAWIYKLHGSLARCERLNSLSSFFGGLIFARKHQRRIDPLRIQREAFQQIPEA